MIKVSISNKNFLEKEYICKTLLYEYLGQKIEILKDDIIDYKIQLENGGELIIEDHFFSNFENDNQYLNKNNLPETIEFCTNEYIVEDNLPIIFGKSNIQTSKKKIICSIDIFCSKGRSFSCNHFLVISIGCQLDSNITSLLIEYIEFPPTQIGGWGFWIGLGEILMFE